MRGISHGDAARFSFLMSIPAILGAAVFNWSDASALSGQWPVYGVGFATSFLIGYVAIGIVIKVLASHKFYLFGYYCFAVGGAVLGYVALGNA